MADLDLHRAEGLASTLPPLLLAAERVASTVAQGVHGRRKVGTGESFWQFRAYRQGDPLHRIDWRQTAKSAATTGEDGPPILVREFEWEAAQSVFFWCDASPSMRYGSHKYLPSKLDRARILTLALAALLVSSGERVGLIGTDESGQARAMSGRSALLRMTEHLLEADDAESGKATIWPSMTTIPKYAHVILISDFLTPPGELAAQMASLKTRRVRGALVQVLDPAEEELPFRGHVHFEGLENEGGFSVTKVQSIRTAYDRRLRELRTELQTLAASLSFTSHYHRTDHSPEQALLSLYQGLSAALQR